MCDNDKYACFNAFVLAVLLAFLIGLLFFLGIITDATVGLIVAIVSAFVIAISLFVAIVIPRYNECVRKHSCGILIGIIGTIFFATISLSITLDTDIISAILIGLVVFFLTYLIIKFLKLLTCIINRNESDDTTEESPILDATLNLDNTINTNVNTERSNLTSNLNSVNNTNSYTNRDTRYCSYNRNLF